MERWIATAAIKPGPAGGSKRPCEVTATFDGDLVRVRLQNHETWARCDELVDVKSTGAATPASVVALFSDFELEQLGKHRDPALVARILGAGAKEVAKAIDAETRARISRRDAERKAKEAAAAEEKRQAALHAEEHRRQAGEAFRAAVAAEVAEQLAKMRG